MRLAIIAILAVLLSGCSLIAPQTVKINDQIVTETRAGAKIALDHYPFYRKIVYRVVGETALQDPANYPLKYALDKLDELDAKPKPLSEEDCVDVVWWYGKAWEAGGPQLVEAFVKFAGIVAKYTGM